MLGVATALFAASATSLAGAALPDGRAYELVSPPAGKNGADVLADSGRIRAADDGNAVVFPSLTAFGDVRGTSIASDYMATRTGSPGTNGWVTHAITPRQEPSTIPSLISEPLYLGEFSRDLAAGVFRAASPVTENPTVAMAPNLYLRRDLRTAGEGSYALLTPCPLCEFAGTALPPLARGYLPIPVYAGFSDDNRTVLVESLLNLTTDAPPQATRCATATTQCLPRAYEWRDGLLRLPAVVPQVPDTPACGRAAGLDPCVIAPASIWGQGAGTTVQPNHPVNVISGDAARRFFTVPTDEFGDVTNGTQRYGRIYMRGDDVTVELSASERTDCAGDPSCGGDDVPDPAPEPFSPATYWGAAADGSRVFFTSTRALTDDAVSDNDRKLYMYDTTRPAADPRNLRVLNPDMEPGDASNDVQGVLANSDDGRYVYFMTTGQLVPGEPLLNGDRGVFMWHDGELAYIGGLVLDETTEIMITGSNVGTRPPQTRITPDGRFLIFGVHDGSRLPGGGDHGDCETPFGVGCREIYVYDAANHRLACASCGESGAPPTSDAAIALQRDAGGAATTWHLSRALTDDGSHVFFTTSDPLLPQDANGKADPYQYDVATGRVELLTSGTDGSDSYFMDASPSGHDVFIVTRERLVRWDVDTSYDLYDVRIGGGLPDPVAQLEPCSGPACQGAPPPPPAGERIGSDVPVGSGDLSERFRSRKLAKRCRRGRVKRLVRGKRKCVRPRPRRNRQVTHKGSAGPRHERRGR